MRDRLLSLLLALFLLFTAGCVQEESPPEPSGLFRDWSGAAPATRVRLGEEFLGWTLTGIAEVPGDPVTDWPGERRAVFEGEVWVRGLLVRDDGRGWYRQTIRFYPLDDPPLPRWDGCGKGKILSLLPQEVVPEETKEKGYYDVRELRPMEYFQEAERTLGLSQVNRFMECRLLLTRWEVGRTEEPDLLSEVIFASRVEPIRQETDSGLFRLKEGDLPILLRKGDTLNGWTLEKLDPSEEGVGQALFTGETVLRGKATLGWEEGGRRRAGFSFSGVDAEKFPQWYGRSLARLSLLPDWETMPEDTEAYNQAMEEFFQTAGQRPDREYEYTLTVSRYETKKRPGDWEASEGTAYISRLEVTDLDPDRGVFTDRSGTIEPREVRMGEEFLGWTLTNVTGDWDPFQWENTTCTGERAVFEGEKTLRGWINFVDCEYPGPYLDFVPEDPTQLPKWQEDGEIFLFPQPDESLRGDEEKGKIYPWDLQVGNRYPCQVTVTRIECLRFCIGLSHSDIFFSKIEPLD